MADSGAPPGKTQGGAACLRCGGPVATLPWCASCTAILTNAEVDLTAAEGEVQEVARKFVRLWTERRLDLVPEIFADEAVLRSPEAGVTVEGAQPIARQYAATFRLRPRLAVDRAFEDDGSAWALYTVTYPTRDDTDPLRGLVPQGEQHYAVRLWLSAGRIKEMEMHEVSSPADEGTAASTGGAIALGDTPPHVPEEGDRSVRDPEVAPASYGLHPLSRTTTGPVQPISTASLKTIVWIGSLLAFISLFLPWFAGGVQNLNPYGVVTRISTGYLNAFSASPAVAVLLGLITLGIDGMFGLSRYSVGEQAGELHPMLLRAASGAAALGTVAAITGVASRPSKLDNYIRGHLSFGGFIAIIGCGLMTLALFQLANRTLTERKAAIKSCPNCAEVVKADAARCRYCGHYFSQAKA
jgi:hypothetical protein